MKICNECETVAHCTKHGCIPKVPAKDAMKLALEALEAGECYLDNLEAIVYGADDLGTHEDRAKMQEAITAIREALAEQPAQQEPVATVPREWRNALRRLTFLVRTSRLANNDLGLIEAIEKAEQLLSRPYLYTSPQPAQQQSTLKNMTDADFDAAHDIGQPAQQEPLTCDICGKATPDPWHFSTPTSRHQHACDSCWKPAPVQQEPVAWAVYWGHTFARKHSVHFEHETAKAVASEIKSFEKKVRPLVFGDMYPQPVQQPAQQEPVAWRWSESNGQRWFDWTTDWSHHDKAKSMGVPIEYAYTSTPAQRKPLDAGEISRLWKRHTSEDGPHHNPYDDDGLGFARAIEAKNNIKENT